MGCVIHRGAWRIEPDAAPAEARADDGVELVLLAGVAPEDIVPVSALCGFGLDKLRARALALLVTPGVEEDLVVTSARQAAALNDAAAALGDAAGARRLGLDAVLEGLAACAQSLGQVTGEDIQPALLQQIFSRFCVGK